MSEHPTTGQVKAAYVNHTHEVDCVDSDEVADDFDRWLAEHDRQVAAAAWDEAIDETEGCGWIFDYVVTEMHARNPYKEQE